MSERWPEPGEPGPRGDPGERGAKGDPGERGAPGESVNTEAIKLELREPLAVIQKAMLDMATKALDTAPVVSAIEAAAVQILSALPADGKDGRDGKDANPKQWRFDIFRGPDGLIDYVIAKPN